MPPPTACPGAMLVGPAGGSFGPCAGDSRETGDGRGRPAALEVVQLRCEGTSDRLEAVLRVAVFIGAGVSGGESHRCS